MTQNQIKEWIENRLNSKGRRSMMISIRNSINIQNIIKSYTNFLPEDCPHTQRAWHIINDCYELPKCKSCNKETSYSHRCESWGYLEFCSVKCAVNDKDIINKKEKTSIEKYGTSNVYSSEWFKEHYKKTMVEKYGVEHNSQLEHNIEKNRNFFKSEEFKDKSKKTTILKYGVDHYSKTNEFKEKFKSTCLSKFGFEHNMQNSEIAEKQMLSCKKTKKYKLPSGKIINIQGYEDRALDILFNKGFDEYDILYSRKEIENEIGKIMYFYGGIERRYFPDFYIKSINTIIEVKSTWTYNKNGKIKDQENKNIFKKNACLNMSINFEFMIL